MKNIYSLLAIIIIIHASITRVHTYKIRCNLSSSIEDGEIYYLPDYMSSCYITGVNATFDGSNITLARIDYTLDFEVCIKTTIFFNFILFYFIFIIIFICSLAILQFKICQQMER